MVFVAVGHDKTADFALFVFEISDVGDGEVDSGDPLVGEAHATIDDKDVAVGLVDVHVVVDIGSAAEGDDFDLFGLGWVHSSFG